MPASVRIRISGGSFYDSTDVYALKKTTDKWQAEHKQIARGVGSRNVRSDMQKIHGSCCLAVSITDEPSPVPESGGAHARAAALEENNRRAKDAYLARDRGQSPMFYVSFLNQTLLANSLT